MSRTHKEGRLSANAGTFAISGLFRFVIVFRKGFDLCTA